MIKKGHPEMTFTGKVDEGSIPNVGEVTLEMVGIKFNLDPRYDLANHSPDGFAWGYLGSGPAQLALALLAAVSDDRTALKHYQAYKFSVIAGLSGDWKILESEIDEWLLTRFISA